MKAFNEAIKWANATIMTVWICVALLLIIGEDAPAQDFNMFWFLVLKACGIGFFAAWGYVLDILAKHDALPTIISDLKNKEGNE